MLNLKDYDFSLLDKQNEFYLLAFSYVDEFKKIIKKYDGKMPSKRIETDLQKVSKCFVYRKESQFNWWHITFYCPQEMRYITTRSRQIESTFIGEYIKDDSFQFVGYEKDEPINAESIIQRLERNVFGRLESIKKQNEVRQNLEKLIAEFNEAGEKFKKASDNLSALNYVVKTENIRF